VTPLELIQIHGIVNFSKKEDYRGRNFWVCTFQSYGDCHVCERAGISRDQAIQTILKKLEMELREQITLLGDTSDY